MAWYLLKAQGQLYLLPLLPNLDDASFKYSVQYFTYVITFNTAVKFGQRNRVY